MMLLARLLATLKRVVEFEDFASCWPADHYKAKGLVADLQRITNTKDSFTRMKLERETEHRQRVAQQNVRIEDGQRRNQQLAGIRADLFSLFSEQNSWCRGKTLEGVLNRLFQTYDVLIREAFTLAGDKGEGIVEQIDGVIELDGEIYLVEMKWMNETIGPGVVSHHLVRVFTRGNQARGIFISYSDFTDAAVRTCRESMAQGAVMILCSLQEIVHLLEREGDLKSWLKEKVHAAIVDKNPWHVSA